MGRVKIPDVVKEWVSKHKGSRKPRHTPGCMEDFITSPLSVCWGNNGGIRAGNYLIGICQPSPLRKGDAPMFLYDFKEVASWA